MSMRIDEVPGTVEGQIKLNERMARRILTLEFILSQLGQTETFTNDLVVERARLKRRLPVEFMREYVRNQRENEHVRANEKGIHYY
jgi:hypothetical protein